MSGPTVVGLSIPADDTQAVAVVTLEPSVAAIRRWVGGSGGGPYLEPVSLSETVHVWLDEDGRAKGLPHNERASRLIGARVLGGSDIRGDVLVLGSTEDGDEASLTVDALAWLANRLGLSAGLYSTEGTAR